MSRHHLLNLTTVGIAALLIGAVLVAVTGGPGASNADRVALTIDQQELIQEITLGTSRLAAATDLESVTAARSDLGLSIYRFDQNLSALLDGGTGTDLTGNTVALDAATGETRRSLTAAADIWLRTGLPLSDLAAGSFSSFSAAGRAAIAGFEGNSIDLTQHLVAAANALNTASERRVDTRGWAAGIAVALGLVLAGIIYLRRRPSPAPVATEHTDLAPAAVPVATATPVAVPAANPLLAPPTPRPYTSPVDLENLSNTVDQLSVDMQTIGDSSDKMQLAIDSVGHALQGMLYSLNEMARDTADGKRVVKGAHSAAVYTAEVAEALVESVKEMSRVVGNVTELARRTHQTSTRLDTEAAVGDRTGRGFNLAVASEVRGLADKTSNSTAAIEATVSEMLACTREYEEAIAEIIQHVSSINRVSRNLGEVMLDPPPPQMVPAPTPPVPEPVGYPVDVVTPTVPETAVETVASAASPDDFAAETAAAIEEATEALGEVTPEPAAEPEAEVEAAASEPEPQPETFSLDDPADAGPPDEEEKQAPFVMSRAQDEEDGEPEADQAAEPEVAVAEPEAEPEVVPEPVPEPEPTPAPEPEAVAEPPADEGPEPAPEATADDGDGDEPAVSDGESPNIFMLNDPDTLLPSRNTGAEAAPEPETVPAGDD